MSSAAEARFRVQAPNSSPRTITVIALDTIGETVVRRLAAASWEHARFFTALRPGDALHDIAGHVGSLGDEVQTADLVILVAGPGGEAHAASAIGEACSTRRVMTTGFVVRARSASESAMAKTLSQLRPWSLMTVIADGDEYIDDMLTALRA